MVRLLFFLFSLLYTGLVAYCQELAGFQTQHFTTDNGMPSNGIKGMQWDEKTGFLWVATEAGIVRFNGVDFRSYTKENMPSITSERMLFMVRNNAGNIYISDLPGNIFSKAIFTSQFSENSTIYFRLSIQCFSLLSRSADPFLIDTVFSTTNSTHK